MVIGCAEKGSVWLMVFICVSCNLFVDLDSHHTIFSIVATTKKSPHYVYNML